MKTLIIPSPIAVEFIQDENDDFEIITIDGIERFHLWLDVKSSLYNLVEIPAQPESIICTYFNLADIYSDLKKLVLKEYSH